MTERPSNMSGLEALYKITQGQILRDPLYETLKPCEQDYLRELAASELEKGRSEDLEFRKKMEDNAQKDRVAAFFALVLFLIVGFLLLR